MALLVCSLTHTEQVLINCCGVFTHHSVTVGSIPEGKFLLSPVLPRPLVALHLSLIVPPNSVLFQSW